MSFTRMALALTATVLLTIPAGAQSVRPLYPWSVSYSSPDATLAARIAPPAGFERTKVSSGSFAEWLRSLPLKPEGTPVRLFTGAIKHRQDTYVAVVDIDVGRRNLQQCADAIIRLRAEWLYGQHRFQDIGFALTGGHRAPFQRWARGERPSRDGKRWAQKAKTDSSYASFKRYLEFVFAYAGSYSLERELKPAALADMRIGDVFIKGGFPGHAVLVADMVERPNSSEKRFLLVQSYMPAQDIHVLKNPADPSGSPWYRIADASELLTPEWQFGRNSLRRWP
jgi:Domain of unknown function (4846)